MASPSDCAGWRELVSWDNLLASYRLAAQGKRGSAAVAAFEYHLGEGLLDLQGRLTDGTWQPGPYVHFAVHEPKRRLISAAPFADRVVHHALMRVIEPRFEHCFIGDSYANRRGKGTHAAVARMQQLCRRWPWVLRMDVRRHFPSIDHAILLQALHRRVPEPRLQHLIAQIVASGDGIHDDGFEPFAEDDLLAACRPRGLPIGNLTSQFWSNCYLDALDQLACRTLRCGGYLRYVDDFALFGPCKVQLAEQGQAVREFLARRLRLRVHERAAQVQATAAGVPWLGFVVFPDHRRVKARKVVAATRRLHAAWSAWCTGSITFGELDVRIQGWINHVRHADSWGLRTSVLGRFDLGPGTGGSMAASLPPHRRVVAQSLVRSPAG